MNLQSIGISAALISAAAWALSAVLFKKIGESIPSLGLNLARGGLNLLLLIAPLMIIGIEEIDVNTFVLLGLSGLIGIALGDTFFFEALQRLGAQPMVLLSLLGQVLTVFFALIFLDEYLTINMSLGILLVLAGTFFVLYSKINDKKNKNTLEGIIFGLLSVLCMSVSIIITKKGLASVSAIQAIFIRILWGTSGLLIGGLVTRQLGAWLSPLKKTGLMKKLFMAVSITLFGGFWLSHVALKYIDVSVANTLNSTAPLFAVPLAVIFLKEKVSAKAVIGTVISICGIILLISTAHAEQWNLKPKKNLDETLASVERPGRGRNGEPEKVIGSFGVRPGDTVCDIGSGSGFYSFRLARAVGDSGKVYAVDIDQDMLNYIKNKIEKAGAKNIILVKSEETDPKLPPSACDKVLIVNTYYHFWAPVTTMKNIRDVLKPGGEVAIIDFKKDRAIQGPPYDQRVAKDEVLSQMGEAGYRLARSYDFLKRQYFLVFQKQD